MRNTIAFFTLLVSIIISIPLQAQFSLTGELRPRAEYRHGFSTMMAPQEEAAFFISQRSRLNFNWQNQELSFYLSFQDVRVWGEVPQLNRSDINSSVHEAWGEFSLNPAISLRVGRQELVYDNSRILGNVDWAQQGRSHDLALLRWNTSENSRLHAGFAFNQESERRVSTLYTLPNYKTMQFLWYNSNVANTALSVLFLNNGIQFSEDLTVFSQTIGGRVSHGLQGIDLSGSVYLQTGRDGANRRLNAFYMAAQASRPFSETLTGIAGFEFLSGNDLADVFHPTRNRAFNPLFGTNHAFNGHMDYFYVGNHISNVGLINPYLTLQAVPSAWSFTATLHFFMAHGTIHQPATPLQSMSSYLGTELDLIAGYTISPQAALRFGYSHMFATQSMERIKTGSKDEINNWAWVMVVLKPTLFEN